MRESAGGEVSGCTCVYIAFIYAFICCHLSTLGSFVWSLFQLVSFCFLCYENTEEKLHSVTDLSGISPKPPAKYTFQYLERSLTMKNKTNWAFFLVCKYLQTNLFSQRSWIIFEVSVKSARNFSCCLTFQSEYRTERWFTVSETTLERIQAVCALLRHIKVALVMYLIFGFLLNQQLETDIRAGYSQ